MNGELEQLGERIAEQAAHLDAATHRLLTDLREFDERGGWRVQGTTSCAHWLAWRVGWDLITARDHVRVARKLVDCPLVDDALRRGEVSYSKVRALLRVATPANESLLLEYARLMTASQLEKLCRKYALVQRQGEDPHPLGDEQRRYVRRRDTEDGMVKIEAVLHAEEAEMVWAMLDHAAKQLAREPASGVAESQEDSLPGASATRSPAASAFASHAGGNEIGDSAESRADAAGLPVAPRSHTAETSSGAESAMSLSHAEGYGIGDSAESRVDAAGLPVAPRSHTAETSSGAESAMSLSHAEDCGIGDSAESRVDAAGLPVAPHSHAAPISSGAESAMSLSHAEGCGIGDSAESRADAAGLPVAPHSHTAETSSGAEAAMSLSHAEGNGIGDSAESRADAAGLPVAPHSHTAETSSGAEAATTVSHAEGCGIGDSAESRADAAGLPVAPRSHTAETSSGAEAATTVSHAEGCGIGDSAESWVDAAGQPVAPRSHAAPTSSGAESGISLSHAEGCGIGDSAESNRLAARSGVGAPPWFGTLASPWHAGRYQRHDSTESRMDSEPAARWASASTVVLADHATGRSLLDRLLDEADGLRCAEAEAREARDRSSEPAVPDRAVASISPHEDSAASRHEASALRQQAGTVRRAFHRADALVWLAQGYLRGDRPDRSPVEVTVTVPAASLHRETTDPLVVGEIGESFLAAETVRRLSCDAGLIEVVEDDHGTPLSVGRKRRTIAGALKRALHNRDRGCVFPDCSNRLFLEGHHIKHWADGGETSLMNATLLCSWHHRHVHEYGYTIELGPDQRPRFRDPRGRLVETVPARPAVMGLGWPRIREMNEALAIGAATIAGPWDGTPVDYGTIVGHLAAADDVQRVSRPVCGGDATGERP